MATEGQVVTEHTNAPERPCWREDPEGPPALGADGRRAEARPHSAAARPPALGQGERRGPGAKGTEIKGEPPVLTPGARRGKDGEVNLDALGARTLLGHGGNNLHWALLGSGAPPGWRTP